MYSTFAKVLSHMESMCQSDNPKRLSNLSQIFVILFPLKTCEITASFRILLLYSRYSEDRKRGFEFLPFPVTLNKYRRFPAAVAVINTWGGSNSNW